MSVLTTSLLLGACGGNDGELPAAYRTIAVPEGRLQSAAARERGRELFLRHCALCHGERGDGRGLRREAFNKPPRDFTDAAWRRSTSPRRVYFVIREGVHGTPMPAWRLLSEDESWDIVAHVLTIGGRRR